MKNSFKLSKYLKKYSGIVVLYIFIFLVLTVLYVTTPILSAEAIEDITLSSYDSAIRIFLVLPAVSILHHSLSSVLNFLYNKYGMKMIGDMSLDCVAQSFKINSGSYSNHNSGQFMERIVNDPNRIVNNMVSVIDYISSMISILAILTYIFVLNYIIGLCILFIIIVSSVIDYIRIKKFSKNQKKAFDAHDNLVAIVNETIKSEKDIKTSDFERKLNKFVNDKTNKNIEENYKLRNNNQVIRSVKFAFQDVLIIATLILGVVLMEKGLVTIAIFMIIYSYRGSIKSFSTYFGNLSEIFTSIKNSLRRIRELFEDNEYEMEKFGDVHLDNVQGEITFKDVTFK